MIGAAALLAVAALAADAGAAPAAVPAGRKFTRLEPAKLAFSVETSAGTVSGTVDVVRLEARGIEGWGRFELRLVIDPGTVSTGDALLDRAIARSVLLSDQGPLVVVGNERLASQPLENGQWLLGATAWMDARRSHKRVTLRYRWEGDAERGTLRLEHEAPLDELGLAPPQHPFVRVVGPLRLSLDAALQRER